MKPVTKEQIWKSMSPEMKSVISACKIFNLRGIANRKTGEVWVREP